MADNFKTRGVRRAPPRVARAGADVLASLARKTKFVDPKLSDHWPSIAGPRIAALGRPGRLTGRRPGLTLEVYAQNAAAAAELQMASDELLVKLNRYLGPGSVARIAIKQASPPPISENTELGKALSSFRAAIQRRNEEK